MALTTFEKNALQSALLQAQTLLPQVLLSNIGPITIFIDANKAEIASILDVPESDVISVLFSATTNPASLLDILQKSPDRLVALLAPTILAAANTNLLLKDMLNVIKTNSDVQQYISSLATIPAAANFFSSNPLLKGIITSLVPSIKIPKYAVAFNMDITGCHQGESPAYAFLLAYNVPDSKICRMNTDTNRVNIEECLTLDVTERDFDGGSANTRDARYKDTYTHYLFQYYRNINSKECRSLTIKGILSETALGTLLSELSYVIFPLICTPLFPIRTDESLVGGSIAIKGSPIFYYLDNHLPSADINTDLQPTSCGSVIFAVTPTDPLQICSSIGCINADEYCTTYPSKCTLSGKVVDGSTEIQDINFINNAVCKF